MAEYSQHLQVFDCFCCTLSTHLTCLDESPQRVQNLHVKKMRRVEVIILPVDTAFDTSTELRLEQKLGDG